MRLGKCPQCDRIIDLDEIDELDDDTVIGCGLNEDDFLPCDGCPGENHPYECEQIRLENGWAKTTIADMAG